MTLTGYFFMNRLIAHASGSIPVLPQLDTPHLSETMGCVTDSSCHSKAALYAVGLFAGGALVGYLVANKFGSKRLNKTIKLDCPKIADACDIEDIGEKKSFCRCWKSEKFPYCDGTHNKHNKETGDNVGPVTIKGKPAN